MRLLTLFPQYQNPCPFLIMTILLIIYILGVLPNLLGVNGETSTSDRPDPITPNYFFKLPALARCSGKEATIYDAEMECISKCPEKTKPEEWKPLKVFDYVQSTTDTDVSFCETYQYTRYLTETWLFSKIESPVTRQRISLNKTRCQELFRDTCGSRACTTSAYLNFPGEYSYASTVKTTLEESVMTTKPGLVSTDVQNVRKLKIKGVLEELDYSNGSWEDLEGKRIYFWEVQKSHSSKECHLKEGRISICKRIQSPRGWICPYLGITLLGEKPVSHLETGCSEEPYFTDGVYIYSESTKFLPVPKETNVPFIYYQSDKREFDELITGINHALAIRDRESCIEQCLKLKDNLPHGSLILAYYSYWATINDSHVRACMPEYECSIPDQVKFCGDPPMMQISCQSGKSWLQLDSLITTDDAFCHKARDVLDHPMRIPTSIGYIMVNKTGAYIDISNNTRSNPHPDLTSNPYHKNPAAVFHPTNLVSPLVPKPADHKSLIESNVWDPFGSLNASMEGIRTYLGSIGDEIKLCILIIIVVFLMIIFYQVLRIVISLCQLLADSIPHRHKNSSNLGSRISLRSLRGGVRDDDENGYVRVNQGQI